MKLRHPRKPDSAQRVPIFKKRTRHECDDQQVPDLDADAEPSPKKERTKEQCTLEE
jgi:hypothetical protein